MCIVIISCHLPVTFANYFLLNNELHLYYTRSSNHLHSSCVNTSYGTRCSKFKASQLWNSIPKNFNKLNTFRKHLKSYILNNVINP